MSTYSILVGGYRPTFGLITFEPSTAKIKVVSESKAPEKASWIETSATKNGPLASSRILYTLSEVDKGLAVSLKLTNDNVEITGERETHGSPAHIHVMKDGSGIVASNFMGGSLIFFPVKEDGSLSTDSESPLLELPFVYKDTKAPNPERQDAAHAHQVIEGEGGLLYVPDLGSDRVWVVEREGASGLAIKGWLQAPPGVGPRHAVISPNGKYLYLITEMANDLYVFNLDGAKYPLSPSPDFKASILPPSVPEEGKQYMNAAELLINPAFPNVLYATNRLELSLDEKSGGKVTHPDLPSGDAIAVITLNADGSKVENVKHVRTSLNNLRGAQISADGKYVAVGGRKEGGIEIWQTGANGTDWKLAGKDEKIENVTDLVWL
ncbi:hypothetical protein CI109_100480 [Kwoniella shandongensis]|uniref:Uncharacterized protein n=1 Tax=Kwoniella shandongensis TaxID=1734106 RepID=A0A5M6C3N2_9TREE|nr:uncharacterized protein CI109_001677 [Kwoniella shandongensis]KAA5529738.1 hypothetical protein CI109_001677 [Kwoniella shandongensis]